MLKELKQYRKQKKTSRRLNIQSRKEKFQKNCEQQFPVPNLDKPTDHLIEENYNETASNSAKITRQILKFWLI